MAENSKQSWSKAVKNEAELGALSSWPQISKSESNEGSKETSSEKPIMPSEDFPDLASTSGVHQKTAGTRVSSELRPFRGGLSSKTRKKLKEEFSLGSFLKPRRAKKPNVAKIISKKTLDKILEGNIVQYRGKKRLKKKTTTLKKNILRIRKEKDSSTREIPPSEAQDERQSPEKAPEEEVDEANLAEKLSRVSLEPPKAVRHSRNFRPYCDNLTSPDLASAAEDLITRLHQIQDKAYHKNKERYKKRFVVGLKDARKFLELKHAKLVIVATDLEPSPGEGGLDELVEVLKSLAEAQNTPIGFVLKRRKLGYLLMKKAPISCIAILDYQSAEELFDRFVRELRGQKEAYSRVRVEPPV